MSGPAKAQPRTAEIEAHVDILMRGAIDLHCHSGPSTMPRLVDHQAAFEQAAAAGMRAILFKDHYYPTGPFAEMLKERFPGRATEPIGSVVLNNAVGGLNPYAVEHALKVGGRMVWMPTQSAANHIREGHRKVLLATKTPMRKPTTITILTPHGELLPEVGEVLDVVAQYDATLSSGHLHISEIWPLFDEARRRGVKRLVVNHPTYTVGASFADLKELAGQGVWLEHSICMFVPGRFQCFGTAHLQDVLKAGTLAQSFFGSDLGQINNPTPVEGFRELIRLLLNLGFSQDEIRRLTGENAAKAIGLASNARVAVQTFEQAV